VNKPKRSSRLAITPGDPSGIGPEILLQWLQASAFSKDETRPLVVGSRPAMNRAAAALKIRRPDVLPDCQDPADPASWGLVHIGPETLNEPTGKPSSESGAIAVDAIHKAWAFGEAGYIEGLVTGPINKVSIAMAGCPHPGHTEILKELANVGRVTMMLTGKGLRVALVTTHTALREVPKKITQENVVGTIRQVWSFLNERLGLEKPKILVCGLNPHAGDGDRFGTEDSRIITPAVKACGSLAGELIGPVPADTAFTKAVQEKWDAVVAMYHDQGLGPLKLHAFGSAINITLGLPIIRTSVDHGTAFELVGTGKAGTQSLEEAYQTARFLTA